jgi:hypothetical protein
VGSPLTALDTSLDGFCRDLEALDSMSSRTCDTVHVFYVRAGQKTSEEILSNVVSYLVARFNYDVGFLLYQELVLLLLLHKDSCFIFTAVRINGVSSLPGVSAVPGLGCQRFPTSRLDWSHIYQLEGHTTYCR